jgi:hypothetical protein
VIGQTLGTRVPGKIYGEKNMETTQADHSEENTTTQKTKMKPEEDASAERAVDKFAVARSAKKKEKRKRHRAKLKRPHTGG